MSWSRMSRPTEDEPARCLSVHGGRPSCPVCLSTRPSKLSVDRPRHFFYSHGARQQATWGQVARTRTKVTVLAFRHKPPPAKDRSERWLPPRSGLAGAAGSQADWFETTHQDKPGRGFSSRPSNTYRPGTTLLHLIALSHTPTLSLSNVFEHKKRSKSSRQPPDGEWRLETDQGR